MPRDLRPNSILRQGPGKPPPGSQITPAQLAAAQVRPRAGRVAARTDTPAASPFEKPQPSTWQDPLWKVTLGALGTSPSYVGQAARHPVAAAQGKLGTQTVTLGGKTVPSMEGVLPWPSPAKKAAEAAARGVEEAAQAVSDASKTARAQGHGLRASTPMIPKVEPGVETAATGGAEGAQVRQGLKGAGPIRSEQQAGYSAERAKRAGAAAQAMQEGGVAGHQAALAALKGELPKLNFQGFSSFNQDALEAMLTHVQEHPGLRPLEKVAANNSILKAIAGKVPTQSEQKLLERAFGRDATAQIVESIPYWKQAKNLGQEVLNVPRAVMASADVSAPFRQGLMIGVSHPGIFFKNFGPMVKSLGSERVYQSLMNDIYERESFPLMQKAKLAITDVGGDSLAGTPLSQREEQFMSNLAEHLHEIPGIRRTPAKYPLAVVSHTVRASGRAYTGFLNKTRADVFDYLVHSAAQQGRDVNEQHLVESIARFVNSATGRGDLGAMQKHAVALNTLLFSPRLMWSRLNFLNPVYYARLDPFARKEALKAARNLVGTMGLVLYLAKLGGATVNTDPRNADFAKIKIGNTRIDIAGGFQQYIRLLAQISPSFMGGGKIISSTTGNTLTLGPQGPGKLSRLDIIQRFFEGKLAPVPSLVNDLFKGTEFDGKPFSWKRAAYQRMIPLLAQDATDLYHASGPAAAIGGYGLGAFGIGLQTYGPKPAAPAVVSSRSRSSSSILRSRASKNSQSILRSRGSANSNSILRH